ncbi:DUF6924 domain-containing protein [Streptomyces sp. NPDC088725]|uniref:DUF6924 domain-containing protein n=1 Tax=Streptomyces sp. NPDC088725 TaxID=3365873 RepID=UPI00382197C7
MTSRNEFSALIIRTDYRDQHAWQAVVTALEQPWGTGEFEALVHIVDDPVWAEATVDEVLAVVCFDDNLSVAFLADELTQQAEPHALPALTTVSREECEDAEECEELTEFGRWFRTEPAGVHDIHANLSVANLGFEEYAAAAQEDPTRIFRSF